MPKEPRMHWLKLWTRGWLEGSVRFDLTPAERSIFIDLIALARESRNPPWVQQNPEKGYDHPWLASRLNIPLELLDQTIEKCKAQERLTENSTGIKILKFEYYQSKTERRKGEAPEGKIAESNIFTLYEQEIGELTPMASERLKDLEKQYPQEDIADAIKEAVRANVRKLSYVEKVLENWARDGKSTGGKRQAPKWMTEEDDANT